MTFTEQLLRDLADAGGRIVKSGGAPDSVNWPSTCGAQVGKDPEGEGAVRGLVP
ncbi:hypothetical protein [Streptomyces sp. NPDC005181]|uniref:hypothetical protein n=1 Tax=Streptomyces sp. NPDC005181 TaxID=3156869 RepID=UPI0033A0D98B